MTTNSATARYVGLGKDGKGAITTRSGVLQDQPYGFATRFEDAPGTNPEELIAAAHAACFTMALSFKLAEAGQPNSMYLPLAADPTVHRPLDFDLAAATGAFGDFVRYELLFSQNLGMAPPHEPLD